MGDTWFFRYIKILFCKLLLSLISIPQKRNNGEIKKKKYYSSFCGQSFRSESIFTGSSFMMQKTSHKKVLSMTKLNFDSPHVWERMKLLILIIKYFFCDENKKFKRSKIYWLISGFCLIHTPFLFFPPNLSLFDARAQQKRREIRSSSSSFSSPFFRRLGLLLFITSSLHLLFRKYGIFSYLVIQWTGLVGQGEFI